MQGSLSANVSTCKLNLALVYEKRAKRAHVANDLDRALANLNQAPGQGLASGALANLNQALHNVSTDAARIYRAANHMDRADSAAQHVVQVEEQLQQLRIDVAAATRTN